MDTHKNLFKTEIYVLKAFSDQNSEPSPIPGSAQAVLKAFSDQNSEPSPIPGSAQAVLKAFSDQNSEPSPIPGSAQAVLKAFSDQNSEPSPIPGSAHLEKSKYRGVIPALMSPTDSREEIDFKALERHLEYLVRKGVSGVYLTGSTGEGFLLSDEERNAMIDAVCRICRGRIVVLAHTGTISLKRAVAMSESAEEAGVDGVSSVPPYYYPFSRQEIIDYYVSLASSTSLPFFVYNIPATTGVDLSVDFLERLFQEENICGVKYTSGDTYNMEQVVRLPGQPIVFSGSDEMSFYGLWAGAQALVGSSYNLLADVNTAMFRAFEKEDFLRAHRHYQLASRLLAVLLKYPYFSALRRVLAWEGSDIGCGRAPFARLSSEQEMDLRRELKGVVADFRDCECSLGESL